jgi:large subunit ribosomal protein L25
METIELKAEPREGVGKGLARKLRRKGLLPAILYGPKRAPLCLSVVEREFSEKITAIEGAHLIRFLSSRPDLQECVALVKDTQIHPVTQRPLHVDFYEVDLNARIRVRVPLHFVGKPQGVVLGGILQPLQREVEIECLPLQIPEFLEVDVSRLGIHDSIHVSQLRLPEGVSVVYHEDIPVVTVLPPVVEGARPGAPEAAESGEAAEAEKKI